MEDCMARPLEPGDPAPPFVAPTEQRSDFRFDTVAGRYIVLSFFGSAGDPEAARMLSAVAAEIGPFNDGHASFFGVTQDRADVEGKRLPYRVPGLRHFYDFERRIAAAYGTEQARISYVLSPGLRVLGRFPLQDGVQHAKALVDFVSRL